MKIINYFLFLTIVSFNDKLHLVAAQEQPVQTEVLEGPRRQDTNASRWANLCKPNPPFSV